jgi:hypothetical protein
VKNPWLIEITLQQQKGLQRIYLKLLFSVSNTPI